MPDSLKRDGKVSTIRTAFSAIVGSKLTYYETADMLFDDGSWDPWPDLPIRLYTDTQKLVAVAWSKFDDLWIATDSSLPFLTAGSTVRWVCNSIERINGALGNRIGSVMLGRGQMSVEGRELEIWTRLLVEVGGGWLEIFNALDENGYNFHLRRPAGIFVTCTGQGTSPDRPSH
jgi:hypothetical protein